MCNTLFTDGNNVKLRGVLQGDLIAAIVHAGRQGDDAWIFVGKRACE